MVFVPYEGVRRGNMQHVGAGESGARIAASSQRTRSLCWNTWRMNSFCINS